MNRFHIYLNNFYKVYEFTKFADQLDCRLELSSGNYAVDGKSLMGIFSLDLSKEIEVRVINQDQRAFDFKKKLEEFLE